MGHQTTNVLIHQPSLPPEWKESRFLSSIISSRSFFPPPLKKRERGGSARIDAPGQCSRSPLLPSLLALIPLFALRSISKLPFSLSVWLHRFLFIFLIFPPTSRKLNALQELSFFFLFFLFFFAQTQFKPRCPQCRLLLKRPAL